MKRFAITAIILTMPSLALAQAADPAFLQRAITTIQSQRNAALDAQAVSEANLAGVRDDLAKAQAKIKELTPAPKPEEPKKSPAD